MNSVCANCQNKGTFIHECSIQYCSIIYPTGLRDEQNTALRQGVSCSINCVLPAGKSVTIIIAIAIAIAIAIPIAIAIAIATCISITIPVTITITINYYYCYHYHHHHHHQ